MDSENETNNYIEDIEELLTHNLEPYMFEPESSVDKNQETEEGNIDHVDREPNFAVIGVYVRNARPRKEKLIIFCCNEIQAISKDKFWALLI